MGLIKFSSGVVMWENDIIGITSTETTETQSVELRDEEMRITS